MNTTSSIIKLPCPSYSIEINTAAATGYFESNLRGDEDGGGLWFTSADGVLTLIDYDGVFALPPAVVKALRAGNIIVPDEFAPPRTAANYKGKPSNRWILVYKDEVLNLRVVHLVDALQAIEQGESK